MIDVVVDISCNRVKMAITENEFGSVKIHKLKELDGIFFRNGSIENIEILSSHLKTLKKELEEDNFLIREVIVNISSKNVNSINLSCEIAINKKVSERDINKLNKLVISKANSVLNNKLIHLIRHTFILDGKIYSKEALGRSCHNLKMGCHAITVAENSFKDLQKAFLQADLEIEGLIFTPLALAENLLSNAEKKDGACLINITDNFCEFVIYKNGFLTYSGNLNFSNSEITNALTKNLHITWPQAEELRQKNNFLSAQLVDVREINIPQSSEIVSIYRYCQIIRNNYLQFLDLFKNFLRENNLNPDFFKGGIILSGEGSQISGLRELVNEHLRANTRIIEYQINNRTNLEALINYAVYNKNDFVWNDFEDNNLSNILKNIFKKIIS